jgi:hypothetical protein
MSSKDQEFDDKYFDEKCDRDDSFENNNYTEYQCPKIEVVSIKFEPTGIVSITESIDLEIKFELDRDVVAAYWVLQFLVDSTHSRIIKVLGETSVEDYPDGESEMKIYIDKIDVSGIPPSTLTNSGLLMAKFIADGEEVASINMVVNVTKKDGEIVREILNPLE